MSSRTLSFRKGKGYLQHNRRAFVPRNVNPKLTSGNIVYAREELLDAYESLFGDAIKAYDKKERHKERKIQDAAGYIRKLENSGNGEQPWYELVVQIGDLYDCGVGTDDGKRAARILDEYMRGFQERNPHLHVFDACMHVDEQTPHLHIDVIPVADYAKGMQRRNSWTRALSQQGFTGKNRLQNSTVAWQDSERAALTEIMERHGWTRTHVTSEKREHLTVSEYKAAVANDRHALDASSMDIPIEKRNVRRGTVVLTNDTMLALGHERERSRTALKRADEALDEAIRAKRAAHRAAKAFGDRSAELARREQEAADLESRAHALTSENHDLAAEVRRLEDQVRELESRTAVLSRIAPVLTCFTDLWEFSEPMASIMTCLKGMVAQTAPQNLALGPYTTILAPLARQLVDTGFELRFDRLSEDHTNADVLVKIDDRSSPFVLAEGFASLAMARTAIGEDIPITRVVTTQSELVAAYEREARKFVAMVQSIDMSQAEMEWLRDLLLSRLVEPVILSSRDSHDMLYPGTFQKTAQKAGLESEPVSVRDLAASWMTADLEGVRRLEETARARELVRKKEMEQERKRIDAARRRSGWDLSR